MIMNKKQKFFKNLMLHKLNNLRIIYLLIN